MINEYSRTELLIGEEGIERLKNASVMVFGVGGVGSHCIEALARSGVGKLILIDNDTVSLTNINRQSIAYHSTVGKYKTQVMKERIYDICPDIEVVTYEMFVLPENIEELFQERVDYIIDAIDTVTAKIALVMMAKLDIRDWDENNEKMGKGLTLTKDELKALKSLLNSVEIEDLDI